MLDDDNNIVMDKKDTKKDKKVDIKVIFDIKVVVFKKD